MLQSEAYIACMRVTFYEMLPVEQETMEQLLPGHECIFVDGTLSEKNAQSAVGSEVVCVFVNCQINRAVINGLPELKVIATRSTGCSLRKPCPNR